MDDSPWSRNNIRNSMKKPSMNNFQSFWRRDMKHRILREVILGSAAEILATAFKDAKTRAVEPVDRYLPMPYDDFAALSRLTTPESAPQYKAAVVSAIALFKFKENSSYWPEQFPWCRKRHLGRVFVRHRPFYREYRPVFST
jgi:hypothetical protein